MSHFVFDNNFRINGEIVNQTIDEKTGRIEQFTFNPGGTKHDTGKPDLSLVPRVAVEEIAKALTYGEKKYERYNYLKGFNSNRLIAASLRHITAWQDGEEVDAESGLSHMAHALACLSMLLHCKSIGTLVDGRFNKGE